MATTNAQYNAAPARPATAWKQRLGTGVVAWVALGVVTAFLDPRIHGSGLISLCGGFGAWIATGAGLAAAYTIAHAVYRSRGRTAGLLAGALGLAVIVTAVAVTDWHVVTSGIMTLVCGAIGLALFLRVPSGPMSASDYDDPFGHPYSANYSDNVDYELAKNLDWPRSVQVMTDDDE